MVKKIALLCLTALLVAEVALAQINNPRPLLSDPIVPDAAAPGSSATSLILHGANFVPTSTVNWNGSSRTTTYLSPTTLMGDISASDLANAGTAAVTVSNPAPGGGTSNVAYFHIAAPVTNLSFAESFLSIGSFPASVATGDLNGDGKADQVILGILSQHNAAFVFAGNGDGTFKPPVLYQAGPNPGQIAIGNFSLDTAPDLATVNTAGAVNILINEGDGTFSVGKRSSARSGSNSLASADFDRDGNLDVVATAFAQTGGASILFGQGDGTFRPFVSYRTQPYPGGVATGDFNSDGIPDFAVTNQANNSVSVFLNNGDGTFASGGRSMVGRSPYGIAVADLNGDAIPDIVTGEDSGSLSVLIGDGAGGFLSHTVYALPTGSSGAVAVADVNNDNLPDIVASSVTGSVLYVLLGNGDGTFQPLQSFNLGTLAYYFATADFNNDGLIDFTVLDDRGGDTVLLQTSH